MLTTQRNMAGPGEEPDPTGIGAPGGNSQAAPTITGATMAPNMTGAQMAPTMIGAIMAPNENLAMN